jgi:cobalt-zinc-cadmium efflux system membrane fusion protein
MSITTKKWLTLLTVSLIWTSCGRGTADEHGHPHDESVTLAYTLYTGKTELFVEFKPLVAGQPSKFAAHFTKLGETFTSLDSGKITISLIVGDKGIRHSSDKASSPGIFRLALEPIAAGTGKLVFDIETPEYTDKIIIDPVIVYVDQKSAESAEQPEPGGAISFLKEQAWKIEFANEEIKPRPFHEVIKTSGQLQAKPSDETVITSHSNGVVQWNDDVVVGASVRQGKQLLVIASGNLAAGNIESQYREARANFEKAEADYKRVQPLLADKIISQKDYLVIKNTYEQAKIAYETISRNYSSGGQSVSSTSDGFIKQIMVRSGEYVQAGQPLLVVTRDQTLILRADVPLRYYNDLPFVNGARFKTFHDNEVHNSSEMNGKVLSYGKAVGETASLIPVTFSLINDGTLIPGEPVEVYLQSKPIQQALVVPLNALIEEQGNFYVYVQTAGETFDKRPVTLGAQDGVNAQLLSGVREGERVVTKGAYMIKLATQSGNVPAHGHEH